MTKKLLEKLRRLLIIERNLSIALIIGILPLLAALFYLYRESVELGHLKNHFCFIQQRAAKTWKERLVKKEFLDRFSNYDPYYLNNCLEKFVFLEKETKEAQLLAQHPLYCCDSATLERLKFLQENHL